MAKFRRQGDSFVNKVIVEPGDHLGKAWCIRVPGNHCDRVDACQADKMSYQALGNFLKVSARKDHFVDLRHRLHRIYLAAEATSHIVECIGKRSEFVVGSNAYS